MDIYVCEVAGGKNWKYRSRYTSHAAGGDDIQH